MQRGAKEREQDWKLGGKGGIRILPFFHVQYKPSSKKAREAVLDLASVFSSFSFVSYCIYRFQMMEGLESKQASSASRLG